MRKRHLITLISVLGLSAIWYLFLLSPALQRRDAIAFQINEAEKQLADFYRIVTEFPSNFNSQKEMAHRKELLLSQLFSKDHIMRLFDSIEKIAEQHDVRLVEISPSVEELLRLNREMPKKGQPQILELSLNLKGTLENVGRFIGEIERGNFYKGVSLCGIMNPQAGHKESDIQYRFKAVLGAIEDS